MSAFIYLLYAMSSFSAGTWEKFETWKKKKPTRFLTSKSDRLHFHGQEGFQIFTY